MYIFETLLFIVLTRIAIKAQFEKKQPSAQPQSLEDSKYTWQAGFTPNTKLPSAQTYNKLKLENSSSTNVSQAQLPQYSSYSSKFLSPSQFSSVDYQPQAQFSTNSGLRQKAEFSKSKYHPEYSQHSNNYPSHPNSQQQSNFQQQAIFPPHSNSQQKNKYSSRLHRQSDAQFAPRSSELTSQSNSPTQFSTSPSSQFQSNYSPSTGSPPQLDYPNLPSQTDFSSRSKPSPSERSSPIRKPQPQFTQQPDFSQQSNFLQETALPEQTEYPQKPEFSQLAKYSDQTEFGNVIPLPGAFSNFQPIRLAPDMYLMPYFKQFDLNLRPRRNETSISKNQNLDERQKQSPQNYQQTRKKQENYHRRESYPNHSNQYFDGVNSNKTTPQISHSNKENNRFYAQQTRSEN